MTPTRPRRQAGLYGRGIKDAVRLLPTIEQRRDILTDSQRAAAGLRGTADSKNVCLPVCLRASVAVTNIRITEPVHAVRPLEPNDRAFDARQQPKGQNDGHRHPDHGMDPESGMPSILNHQQAGNDHVAEYQHDEIGWRVARAVMVKGLSARRTIISNLEIGSEQATFATTGAATPEAAEHGKAYITIAVLANPRVNACNSAHLRPPLRFAINRHVGQRGIAHRSISILIRGLWAYRHHAAAATTARQDVELLVHPLAAPADSIWHTYAYNVNYNPRIWPIRWHRRGAEDLTASAFLLPLYQSPYIYG